MRTQTFIIKNNSIRKSVLKTDTNKGAKRKSQIPYYKEARKEMKEKKIKRRKRK